MTQSLDKAFTRRAAEQIAALSVGPETDDRNFVQWATDPVGFAKEVLRDELLYDLQEDILRALVTEPLVAVKGAHSMGKDHTAAIAALWFAYCKPGRTKVIISGPTQRQVEEILFADELSRAHRRGRLPGTLRTRFLRVPGRPQRLILGIVSNETGRLTGHHAPYVMGIITEAQEVEEHAFTALMANAVGEQDRILVVGNPTAATGPFRETFQANSAWKKITMPATRHPNIIAGKKIVPGGIEVDWVERVRREWTEEQFRTRVEAEFPVSASDALFRDHWVTAAVARYPAALAKAVSSNGYLHIGVDVARFGGDACVVCAIRDDVLVSMHMWDGTDTVETLDRIVRELERLGVKRNGQNATTYVDEGAGGGGASVVDHLIDRGWTVEPFNGTSRPIDNAERYANLRAWGYDALKRGFEDNEIAVPNDKLLLEELRAISYKFNNHDGLQIAAKKDIKRALRRSPDRADALMMAWTARTGGGGGGAAVGVSF